MHACCACLVRAQAATLWFSVAVTLTLVACVRFAFPLVQWIIDMCAADGDTGWHKPMLALVVIVSVLVSGLLFWGMLLW